VESEWLRIGGFGAARFADRFAESAKGTVFFWLFTPLNALKISWQVFCYVKTQPWLVMDRG
jgi:hypothetical protein